MEVVVGYEICAVSTSSGQGEDEAAAGEDAEGCAAVASQERSLALAWKEDGFFLYFRSPKSDLHIRHRICNLLPA